MSSIRARTHCGRRPAWVPGRLVPDECKGHRVPDPAGRDPERPDDPAAGVHPAEVTVGGDNVSIQKIVVSDELGDELAFRLFVEDFWRGDLLDAALLEDGDAIRHGHRLLLIMGHVDDGHGQAPLMRRTSNCISSRSRRSRAPRGSSIRTRRGSKTSARAMATRCCWPPDSLAGRRSLHALQADQFQGPPDALPNLLRIETPHFQGKRQVAPHRHVRKQGRNSGKPRRCRVCGAAGRAPTVRRFGWCRRWALRSRRASSDRWSCRSRTAPAESGTPPRRRSGSGPESPASGRHNSC